MGKRKTKFRYGSRLRHIRMMRGLTQADMASIIGTSTRNYRNYEWEECRLPVTVLYDILCALDISADYFFDRSADPNAHKPKEP